MAHYTISNLKSALTAGGARPNMFQAKIDIPSSTKTGIFDKEDQKTLNANKFLCKSTNIPAETVGVINVPFMGKDLKLTGDRTVDNWSATFINDEDFAIHKLMTRWSDAIYGNLNQMGKRNPNHYMGTIVVTQLMRETIGNSLEADELAGNAASFLDLSNQAAAGVSNKKQTKQMFIEPSSDRGSVEWKMYDCWPVSVSAIDHKECSEEVYWADGLEDSLHQNPSMVENDPSQTNLPPSPNPHQKGNRHPKIPQTLQHLQNHEKTNRNELPKSSPGIL